MNYFKVNYFSISNSTTSCTTQICTDSPSLSFFELSNADKKLINKSEDEQEILNVEREEQK